MAQPVPEWGPADDQNRDGVRYLAQNGKQPDSNGVNFVDGKLDAGTTELGLGNAGYDDPSANSSIDKNGQITDDGDVQNAYI